MRMSSARKQSLLGCLIFLVALVLGLFGGGLLFSLGSSKFSASRSFREEEMRRGGGISPKFVHGPPVFDEYANTDIVHGDIRDSNLDASDKSAEEISTKRPPYRIPNLVHYIILSGDNRPFEFTEYISVLSAYKYQNPDQIWIHCNRDPFGNWWDELMQNISWHKLRVVHMDIPVKIGENAVPTLSHAVDIAKIRVLFKYGGIYVDSDVIFVQSLDPLRIYPSVFGQESEMKLSQAIALAEANSTYMDLLLQSYLEDFRPNYVDYNNGIIPYKLAQKHPDLVYIESASLVTPSLSQKHLLFTDNTELLEWRHLYTVHLMFHKGVNRIYNPTYIIPLKNLVGRLFRRVYYGSDADLDPYLEQVRGRERYNLWNKLPPDSK